MRIGLTSTIKKAAAAGLLLLLASPYAAEAIGVATPEEMNMASEPLAKITDDLRQQVALGQLAGAAFQVYRCVGVVFEGRRVGVGWGDVVGGSVRLGSGRSIPLGAYLFTRTYTHHDSGTHDTPTAAGS